MTRGEGGVSQKVIFDDEGGRGGSDPPKKDDIIYEQPLSVLKYILLFSDVSVSCILTSHSLHQSPSLLGH